MRVESGGSVSGRGWRADSVVVSSRSWWSSSPFWSSPPCPFPQRPPGLPSACVASVSSRLFLLATGRERHRCHGRETQGQELLHIPHLLLSLQKTLLSSRAQQKRRRGENRRRIISDRRSLSTGKARPRRGRPRAAILAAPASGRRPQGETGVTGVFEGLGDRIQGVFKELRGEGHLTEYHLEQALREIRLSLLEADVALPVVRDFTARVKERAVGARVTQQLSPAQEVTRIVRDELMLLLGGTNHRRGPPGETGRHHAGRAAGLGKDDVGRQACPAPEIPGPLPLIVAADLARPAAVQQLVTLGQQIGVPVFEPGAEKDPCPSPARACARPDRPGATRSSSTPPDGCTWTRSSCGEIQRRCFGRRTPGDPLRRRRDDRPGRGEAPRPGSRRRCR